MTCVTARGVLRWFCWMWLVADVGRCIVGCEHCEGYCSTVLCCGVRALWRLLFNCAALWGASTVKVTVLSVLAPYNAAPHNRYQPHPAEPVQHTTCSNTRLVLLKMGIMMPETCWESVDNKHLTVASCWFSLSLQSTFQSQAVYKYCLLLSVYFSLYVMYGELKSVPLQDRGGQRVPGS